MSINYNHAYERHLMCRNCGRATGGIGDYMNIKTGRVTKTCQKCRASVLASVLKKDRICKKKIPIKEQNESLKKIIQELDEETLGKLKETYPILVTILNNGMIQVTQKAKIPKLPLIPQDIPLEI